MTRGGKESEPVVELSTLVRRRYLGGVVAAFGGVLAAAGDSENETENFTKIYTEPIVGEGIGFCLEGVKIKILLI